VCIVKHTSKCSGGIQKETWYIAVLTIQLNIASINVLINYLVNSWSIAWNEDGTVGTVEWVVVSLCQVTIVDVWQSTVSGGCHVGWWSSLCWVFLSKKCFLWFYFHIFKLGKYSNKIKPTARIEEDGKEISSLTVQIQGTHSDTIN